MPRLGQCPILFIHGYPSTVYVQRSLTVTAGLTWLTSMARHHKGTRRYTFTLQSRVRHYSSLRFA